MKQAFKIDQYLPDNFTLLAVNSINWLRIIAQICYYFFAYASLNTTKPLCFSVPSGNFGNVFSAYSAYKMGLPIEEICVAVNSNDILHRFFSNNDYSKQPTVSTISPSMDISVASNFERLVYDYYLDRDANRCSELFNAFNSNQLELDQEIFENKLDLFSSLAVSDSETKNIINYFFKEHEYILDPHSAIACKRALEESNSYVIGMATAHPDNFPTLFNSLNIQITDHHAALKGLKDKEERLVVLPCEYSAIRDFIRNSL